MEKFPKPGEPGAPKQDALRPARPDELKEFQPESSISWEEIQEAWDRLTGKDPEVEAFFKRCAKERENNPIGFSFEAVMLEDLGITGRSILALYELSGKDLDTFSGLLEAAWWSWLSSTSGAISAPDLLAAIDKVEQGQSVEINVKEIAGTQSRIERLLEWMRYGKEGK